MPDINPPLYRFRNPNMSLASYIQERRQQARDMQAQADMLNRVAAALLVQIDSLETALVLLEPPKEEGGA